jgi:hypothetical protein
VIKKAGLQAVICLLQPVAFVHQKWGMVNEKIILFEKDSSLCVYMSLRYNRSPVLAGTHMQWSALKLSRCAEGTMGWI